MHFDIHRGSRTEPPQISPIFVFQCFPKFPFLSKKNMIFFSCGFWTFYLSRYKRGLQEKKKISSKGTAPCILFVCKVAPPNLAKFSSSLSSPQHHLFPSWSAFQGIKRATVKVEAGKSCSISFLLLTLMAGHNLWCLWCILWRLMLTWLLLTPPSYLYTLVS